MEFDDYNELLDVLYGWTNRVVTVQISGFASQYEIPAVLAGATGVLTPRSADRDLVAMQFSVNDEFWFAVAHDFAWARLVDLELAGLTLYVAQDGVQLAISQIR
jgi:hypothetical protein